MMTIMKAAAVLFVFILSFPCDAAAQTTIQAVGMSTIHKNFVDIARTKAIDEAQRNAVEKSVGVMVSSTSEVENYQLKVDRILSESKGFIERYKIVSEGREGDTYKVLIEAVVKTEMLRDSMEAVNLLVVRKSKPRIMVMFNSSGGKESVIESSIAKYFLAMEFQVVDPELVRRDLEKETPEGTAPTPEMIMKTGARYGAEILIFGNIENSTSKFTMNNVEMRFNRVNASAKAVKIDTGEMIASDNDVRSGPGMEDQIKRMSDEAGLAMAKKLLAQIINRWSNELANTVIVKIVATGLKTYRDLNAFKEALTSEAKGVKQLYQRYYSNQKAEIDVEMRGNAQGLADDMAAMTVNGKKVHVTEISQNRVAVRIK
jgi:hypothetical protein